MSEFWSGVTSGLIGAIIGGVFTTIGVRSQVKASLAAAQMQVSAMLEQQVISARIAMKQMAVTEIVKSLERINSEADQLAGEHYEACRATGDMAACKDGNFGEMALSRGEQWLRELNRVHTTYGGYLNPGAEEAFCRVFDEMPSHSRFFVERDGECVIEERLDSLTTLLMELMDEIPYRMNLSDQVPFHVRLRMSKK